MIKRRRESAGSTRAVAFSREHAASKRKNWSAKGFGSGESSVGGIRVRRNRWKTLETRPSVLAIFVALSFECCASR